MKLAFAGKGGVGKTTLAAWLGDWLARQGHRVWLVDADTALSLGVACGIAPENLPSALSRSEDIIRERIGTGMMCLNPDLSDLPEQLAVDLPIIGPLADGIKPGRKRLLLMGRVEEGGSGCACGANALLKAFLAHMFFVENGYVLVDLEAGVEHLGRGTAAAADGVIVVSEPGLRSLLTAAEVTRLARQIGLEKSVLVVNRWQNAALSLPPSSQYPALCDLPSQHLASPFLASLQSREWQDGCVLFSSGPEQERIDALCANIMMAFA